MSSPNDIQLWPARASGRWGFMDQHGHFVIAPQWRDVAPFHERRALVLTDTGWGYIHPGGGLVGEAKWDDAQVS